jgi:hypothetical protein
MIPCKTYYKKKKISMEEKYGRKSVYSHKYELKNSEHVFCLVTLELPPRRTVSPPAAPAANDDPCDCWATATVLGWLDC